MKIIFSIGLLLLMMVLAPSCSLFESKEKIPDVTALKQDVTIQHLEDLIGKPVENDSMLSHLLATDMTFNCYYKSLMAFDQDGNAEGMSMYKMFVMDSNIVRLRDTVKIKFPDLTFLSKELSSMFAFYKYYFPKNKIPQVSSCISEFGPAAATCLDQLEVSLDMYLGESYPYYDDFDFPDYMQKKFRKEYMCPNMTQALVKNMLPDSIGHRLIDLMIAEGKILYISKKLLPTTEDTLVYGFSNRDIKWLSQNEKEIWGFFIENKLLYNSDMLEIRKYITPGPTTAGMPAESPGNVGTWIGLQIVEKYMNKNTKTTLSDLVKITDGQMMLARSGYKP